VLGYLIVSWPPLLRRILPAWRTQAEVVRRAGQEFVQHGVFETRQRTGVLIMLSELEHRVVILGDKGVDAHVQQSGWATHVDRIVRALRQGNGADGVCQVIAAIGETLAAALPVQSDDVDELDNRVRQEDR
jgi:putative membrane protein